MLVAGSWLYVADPGGSRVVRLWADFDDDDIWKVEPEKNVRPTEQWREQYRLGYQRVTGVHAEAVVTNLAAPSGLAISRSKLFVSCSATGQILAFHIPDDSSAKPAPGQAAKVFQSLGKIQTPAKQIQGLVYDAVTSRLFYVDASADELVLVNPACKPGNHREPTLVNCHCVHDAAKRNCAPPRVEGGTTLYSSKMMTPSGELNNMGGCAREFFSACAGGKGTDSEITAGHLRPCYDLGRAACDPVSGQCRCASTKEKGCRPEWLLRAPRNSQEAAQRGLGTKCVCQPAAARLNLQSYLTESATNSAPPATATDGGLLTYHLR